MALQRYQHKRSWKNLLINRGYQLRFTLFMVGVSALLMSGLGYWVLRVAERTTQVATAQVLGIDCERLYVAPELPAETPPETGAATHQIERTRGRVKVESEIQLVTPTESSAASLEARQHCVDSQKAQIERLEQRKQIIGYALGGLGVLLLFGLFVYGIKMTHRVAGPIYKVGQYLNELKDGRYVPVHNLRKGDHLVEFFEHFKEAHAGLLAMQKQDIVELKAIVSAAEAAGLAGKDPEVAAALEELKILLSDKEKSIVTES